MIKRQIYCWTFLCLLLCTHVSGLYLYLMVVQTFTVEAVKLRVYAFIGWGEFWTHMGVQLHNEAYVVKDVYGVNTSWLLINNYSTRNQRPKTALALLNKYHLKVRPVHKTLTNLAPTALADFLWTFFTNPSRQSIQYVYWCRWTRVRDHHAVSVYEVI